MAASSAKEEQSSSAHRTMEEAVIEFVEANRARCLWFSAPDYLPATDEERLRALQHIERHGDRKAFVRARGLRDWLLQLSNER